MLSSIFPYHIHIVPIYFNLYMIRIFWTDLHNKPDKITHDRVIFLFMSIAHSSIASLIFIVTFAYIIFNLLARYHIYSLITSKWHLF